jgi:hypothetical protein
MGGGTMQPTESWSAAWLSESAPSLAICLKVFGRLSPHFLDLVIMPLVARRCQLIVAVPAREGGVRGG